MSALSEILAAANAELGLSARGASRLALEQGLALNHDTAARYLRGDHGRPDEATLVALSTVFRVPLAELRVAADLPADETEPYVPPQEASRLTRRQRNAVDEVIRAMLEPSAGRATAGEEARLAARHGAAEDEATDAG